MHIDAHQHFWNYDPVRDSWITEDMVVIRRDFLPDDLAPVLQANNIGGCVAVQADQSEMETEFLLALADEHNFIKGVVGWVDLRSERLEERLEYFSQFNKLKGFRHIVQGEPTGFLSDRRFIEGVRSLERSDFTYDLLIYHHQLEEAWPFIQQVGNARIVVDHLAKPSIRTQEMKQWERNMAALAAFDNVYCKVSGMVTEADWKAWTAKDFEPYLDKLFDMFGAQRLMYGSDWPVCLLAASYAQQLSIVQSYIAKLSDTERDQMMGDNASRFYKL